MFKGFRFRREIELLPWLTFNISKTGVSATVGPEIAHVTVGSHGTYVYADMPGSGTYFRRKLDPLMEDLTGEDADNGTSSAADKAKPENDTPPEDVVDFNFFDRLTSRPSEVALADALQALNHDEIDTAYQKAKEAASLPDGAFLAAMLAMKHEDWQAAIEYFERALAERDHLGEMFAQMEVDAHTYLPVSEDFIVAIRPTRRDCLLALAEAHDRLGHNELAIQYLQELREKYDPDDLIVRLLLAELYEEQYGENSRVQHEIVALAEGITNESPLHASLLFYRARALRRLEVLTGARDTLTGALRREKGYPADLLVALRYERALVYEALGKKSRAHEEFEKIYAVAPEYEDVAERLDLDAEIDQPLPEGAIREQPPTEAPEDHAPVDVEVEPESTTE